MAQTQAGVRLEKPMLYFNEYLYYTSIRNFNERAHIAGEPVIKKRQALQLRDQLTEVLSANGVTMDRANRKMFQDSMDQVFQKAMGQNAFEDDAQMQVLYQRSLDDFSYRTGLQARSGYGTGTKDGQGPKALPLSPYDPRFSMRGTFLENGTSLLYAKAEDLNAQTAGMGGTLSAENQSRVFGEDLMLYKGERDGSFSDRAFQAGPALVTGDKSGYSLLSTLVSEKNAREIKAYVNQDGVANPEYAKPEDIRKAYQVMSQLKSEGVSFTFHRDDYTGQLKAKIPMANGGSLEARVLDPKHPEYGAGARIYMDGLEGHYSTDKMVTREDSVTGTKGNYNVSYLPSAKECVDLIKFGMGQHLTRPDGKAVGTVGTYNGTLNRTFRGAVHESYHTGKAFSAMVHPLAEDPRNKVFLRLTSNRSADTQYFRGKEDSDAFLAESVDSARENFRKQMDLDYLIEAHRQHAEDTEYLPAFSNNPSTAAVQERYWDVLTGKQAELLKPYADKELYEAMGSTLEESGLSDSAVSDYLYQDMAYTGTQEEKVRKHLDDLVEEQIGTFAPDADGRRFNPVNVARYMTSSYGQYRNSDDLIAAMRSSDINANELRGDDFYNKSVEDKLIRFDPATARPMQKETSPFMQHMYQTVRDSIRENGCTVDEKDILIDDNGIVQYQAVRMSSKRATESGRKAITGQIGQIFEPDERGLVTTRYAGSDNYTFAPGMTATVTPNQAGQNLPYEHRLKIKTYAMSMEEGIRFSIRNDMMSERTAMTIGSATSLNAIPRRNQGVRFAEGELESKSETLRQAIIAAETGRITFDSEITKSAGRYDLYKYHHDENRDPEDDVHTDVIGMMDGENYAILRPEESKGRLDARATGTGPAQGCRYLVEGASVDASGKIVPASDDAAKNGIGSYIDAHFGDFDAVDRYDMTVTALRHCKDVKPANVAQITFGGWGHGDAVVISKKWAEENGIHNIGDKISDFHGNKGVASLIVDPDMDPKEAEKQNIGDAVSWFKQNPDLDIVMSPYSAVSRFNAGLYREAMSSERKDLVSPDGTVYPGSIGKLDIIIMEQTAEKKTTDYLDEKASQESSRNFGGQTGWSLGANDALATLQSGFDKNTRSVVNFREMLIATGMDMDETGTLRIGYQPHEGEQRPVFEMQPLLKKTKLEDGVQVPDTDKEGRQKLDMAAMKANFGTMIERSGGHLELPFPISFPEGKAVSDGKRVDMGQTPEILPENRSEASKAVYDGKTYALPIMSAYLRSGQEFDDGTSKTHDYTNQYMRIYEHGLKYRDLVESGGSKAELDAIKGRAQQEYNKITDDLIGAKFSGKRNLIRTNLLGAKQHAMTAVVTPDPRLDLEQVSMHPDMAKALGVREGQKVLTWRDPLLTRTGMSAVSVKYDPAQRCMGVSPFTGEDKDRDHDGDTEGIRTFDTKGSRMEADGALNIKNRLLKTGSAPDAEGNYDLSIDSGEDAAAGLIAKPELKGVHDELRAYINHFEKAGRDGQLSQDELDVHRGKALSELNNYVHAVQDASYGVHVISYESPQKCFESIDRYVQDGVKGSAKKLDTFGRYLGVEYERDAQGQINYQTFRDTGVCKATEKERLDPLDARNMQQAYTGPAGGQTIQSMVYAASATARDFRGGLSGREVSAAEIMEAFTSTNKQVTQAVLQVKHSADQAHSMEFVIQESLSSAAAGRKLEQSVDPVNGYPVWTPVRGEDGKPLQATPEEYKQQMMDVYEKGLGVSVSEEKVAVMADFLTDAKTGLIKTPQQRREEAPPLQRMAYDGGEDRGFVTVQKMAAEGRNLYEGSPCLNSAMMPRQLRDNLLLKEARKEDPSMEGRMHPLVETRVRETAAEHYAQRLVQTAEASKHTAEKAADVSAPRRLPEVNFTEPDVSLDRCYGD